MSSTKHVPVSQFAIWLRAFAIVLPATIWNALQMLPRIWLQKLPFMATLWHSVVRSGMTYMPPQYLQQMFPSTLDTYKEWIRRVGSVRGFRERVQLTDTGKTNILWLETTEKYEKVILFFHGGGYVLPLSDGHLDWMAHMHKYLASQGVNVGIAMMEYSLVPQHPYPAQLAQAIDALQTLINTGFEMKDIVLGGDSAGGHLTLSLLSHLHHPRTPDQWPKSETRDASMTMTPRILTAKDSGRMPAAFLVSPLCSHNFTRASYKTRSSADMLCTTIVQDYGKFHLDGSGAQREKELGLGWSMALDMSPEAVTAWWKDVDSVVENVLITVGQEEVFRDHCLDFAEVLRDIERKGTGFKAELLLQQQEAHDAPLFDFAAGRSPSVTTKAIEQFVLDAINGPGQNL